MHIPPPELFWDEPKQPDAGQDVGTPGSAPDPAWAVRSLFSLLCVPSLRDELVDNLPWLSTAEKPHASHSDAVWSQ